MKMNEAKRNEDYLFDLKATLQRNFEPRDGETDLENVRGAGHQVLLRTRLSGVDAHRKKR